VPFHTHGPEVLRRWVPFYTHDPEVLRRWVPFHTHGPEVLRRWVPFHTHGPEVLECRSTRPGDHGALAPVSGAVSLSVLSVRRRTFGK